MLLHGLVIVLITLQTTNAKRPKMIQEPTSIQLLDAAVEQERQALGRPEPADALASLLARWLLIRSDDPHIDVVRLFARAHAHVDLCDRLLSPGSRGASEGPKQMEAETPHISSDAP